MQEYVKRINPDSIVAEVVKPGEGLEVAQAKVITEKMLTITEVTSGFKVLSLELDLIGKQLYNHDNFVCRFYYDSYTSQEFVSFPELKLTVRASNNNLYDVYLKEITFNVRINQVHAKHFYCELVEIVKKVGDYKPFSPCDLVSYPTEKAKQHTLFTRDFKGGAGGKAEAFVYQDDSLKNHKLSPIKELKEYINSDTMFFDFDYIELLLDKMSDKELDEFCSAKHSKKKGQD